MAATIGASLLIKQQRNPHQILIRNRNKRNHIVEEIIAKRAQFSSHKCKFPQLYFDNVNVNMNEFCEQDSLCTRQNCHSF